VVPHPRRSPRCWGFCRARITARNGRNPAKEAAVLAQAGRGRPALQSTKKATAQPVQKKIKAKRMNLNDAETQQLMEDAIAG
jgi:hypothetical protein